MLADCMMFVQKIIKDCIFKNGKDRILKKIGHCPLLLGEGHSLVNGHGDYLDQGLEVSRSAWRHSLYPDSVIDQWSALYISFVSDKC